MTIPVVVVLGVIIWIVTCAFKYWYFGKMKVNYTHKIDNELLEEIRRPSKSALEKAMKRKREPTFVNEPKFGYPFQTSENASEDVKEPKDEDKPQDQEKKKPADRPLTIFEEIDLRKKQGKVKRDKNRYDKSMFEDALSRLYRDLQNEKKNSTHDDVSK